MEVEANKLKAEAIGLHDALLKLQNLNESLGQDKIELNKIILQVSLIWGYIKSQTFYSFLQTMFCTYHKQKKLVPTICIRVINDS